MLFYFIILIFIKFSLLIPLCQENENNCIKCNPITKLCHKCISDIYAPNSLGGCTLTPKCQKGQKNCIECEENSQHNICKTCSKGYFPDSIGGCTYTKNCLISTNGICSKCIDNYVLIGKYITYCKSVFSEDLKSCKGINTLNGHCSNCTEGLFLNSIDYKCTKTENCSSSKYGICTQCNKGYYLDKKEEKCKMQNNTFFNCKESLTGEKCDECDNDYFFDDEGKCMSMNYCFIGDKKNRNVCKMCNKGYYLSEFKDACTTDINCYEGDKNIGLCLKCKKGFYIDYTDGKCKSNTNNDEFKHCAIADNNRCTNCLYGFALSEDLKCSSAKYCQEVYDGKCILCIDKYFLGLDNKCTLVENCIYSNFIEECVECKDNLYYNKKKWKCEEGTGIFQGCKNGYSDWKCSECKNNYYLNQTDSLCYSNEEQGPFYKCALTDFNATSCARCIDNYNLGEIDKKCTMLKGCKIINEENKCIECDEDYCLDVKLGVCEYNFEIKNEDKKLYFRCNRTNEDGDRCKICRDGYIVSSEGLCVDVEHCSEKDKEGKCIKCKIDENGYYCLNKDFGCIETYFDDCLECGNNLDFDKCTKCIDGYEIGEYDLCYEIEDD